ncbi:MAG: alpha/beta hydrolase [Deltaproteobacteria bacterium]
MDNPDLGFHYIYIPPSGPSYEKTILLLHGTGGDEESLIPVAQMMLPGAAVLSPRGKVLENGMPRFFRRLAEGVFDMEDLRLRTRELAEFVKNATEAYGINQKKLVAAGYSNGANIASSAMLSFPDLINAAVLFHPMVPFVPESLPDLSHVEIFITAGTNDPIVAPEQSEALAKLFTDSGARVEVFWHNRGHSLTHEEIISAKSFLEESLK